MSTSAQLTLFYVRCVAARRNIRLLLTASNVQEAADRVKTYLGNGCVATQITPTVRTAQDYFSQLDSEIDPKSIDVARE